MMAAEEKGQHYHRGHEIPPRIAHGWTASSSHDPRIIMAAKTATSKQQKSMKTPNSRCRSRSASAKRPAIANPKMTKASPWTARAQAVIYRGVQVGLARPA